MNSITTRRWRDLFVYAFLGVFFGFYFAILYLRGWDVINSIWPESLSSFERWFFLGATLLLLVLCVKMSRNRWRHLRYFWRYPPHLVSLLIAWTLLVVLIVSFPVSDIGLGRLQKIVLVASSLALWVLAGLIFPLMLRLRPNASFATATAAKSRDELRDLTLDELKGWINQERPIANPGEDYFGAYERALYVWQAIQKRRSVGSSLMQTVVIEGPFGSGKTGIIELLSLRIAAEQPERYILARVSAWGFSSSAARQFVLEQAIEALGSRVDCAAMRGLPRAYVEALSEYAKWLPALLFPWADDTGPVQKLQALTPILKAIDGHLVIVIEDSDRTASDFDPAHLQAMLNDFRQVERLSFILTVGSTARIDYPKLAEQIITIAQLPPSDAALLLDRIRDYCRKDWASIDLIADTPNRPENLTAAIEATEQAAMLFSWRARWPRAVAELLNTPRRLKFVLSSIISGWSHLNGEVDLDELIIMTTLRHTASPVFSFIIRRSFDLRWLKMQEANEREEDKTRREREHDELRTEWRDVAAESEADSRALDILLCNLFSQSICHHSSEFLESDEPCSIAEF
jgi:KAP family P-loop domain